MALSQDDFVGAVAKLNELTRHQIIKWSPCAPPLRPTQNALAALMEVPAQSFQAEHEGRLLRITMYPVQGGLLSLPQGSKYTLDVRDKEGNSMFEFPNVAGISDLFQSIRTQQLDIEGFIKKLAAG